MPTSRVVVRVLTFDGCPQAESAWAVAREAARRSSSGVELIPVDLLDPDLPARYRGYPSPTILVAGGEVSPGDRSPGGSACRLSGAPSVEEVGAAIRAAHPGGGSLDRGRPTGP